MGQAGEGVIVKLPLPLRSHLSPRTRTQSGKSPTDSEWTPSDQLSRTDLEDPAATMHNVLFLQ